MQDVQGRKGVKQACIPSYYLQQAPTSDSPQQTSHDMHTGDSCGKGSLVPPGVDLR